jgi:hypothetical protein
MLRPVGKPKGDIHFNARFDGTLLAWAQRSVRMVVPTGFSTPFRAIVSRREDFVCRTECSSRVSYEKKDDLHYFTYGTDNSVMPDAVMHLRSEQGDGSDRHHGGAEFFNTLLDQIVNVVHEHQMRSAGRDSYEVSLHAPGMMHLSFGDLYLAADTAEARQVALHQRRSEAGALRLCHERSLFIRSVLRLCSELLPPRAIRESAVRLACVPRHH